MPYQIALSKASLELSLTSLHREVLEKEFTPQQLRLMFAMQPWNKEMNFVFSSKRALQKKENTFKFFFQNVDFLLAKEPSNPKMEVQPLTHLT